MAVMLVGTLLKKEVVEAHVQISIVVTSQTKWMEWILQFVLLILQ